MKDTIIKILLIVIAVLFLCNVLLLGVLGILTIVSPKPLDKPSGGTEQEQTQADLPTSTTPNTSAVLKESADMGQAYIDSIIFLGDSTTYHMINRGVLKDGKNTMQVWSGADEESGKPTASGTLTLDSKITSTHIYYPKTGEALTIAEAIAKEKPQYLVITLGVNGISFVKDMSNPKSFVASYGKLIDAVKAASPQTKIMLQSIFPVTAAYDQKNNGITNERIDTANTWIMQLAAEKGCGYLDTASVLKNQNGTMIEIYDAGDGVHMTADAYKAVVQYIRTHGYTE